MISTESKQWLADNITIWERHKIGNHKYLDDFEKKKLQSIAKEVDADRYFTLYGCDSCIRDLIKFVFTAYESETIPAPTQAKKGSGRFK